jgi:hypothetical protein
MNVEREAILTCSACRVEGPHELLYLSNHLRASRCRNCGATRVYSEHIYADYARDVAERTARLPLKLAVDAVRRPLGVLGWPVKALRKPFGILEEMNQVYAFEQSRRSPNPPADKRPSPRR